MKVGIWFSLLLSFVTCTSHAQVSWTTYNTSNSPLQNNTVRALAEDNNQYLWIGTDYGLYHFDGINWQTFDTSNSTIPSNKIRALFIDDNDDLLIGTQDSGLIVYNGSSFLTYTTFNSGIADNFVKAVSKDTSGNTWVGTIFGLCRKDLNDNWTTWNVFNSNLWSNNMSSIVFSDSSIYFGAFNGGLSVLSNTTLSIFNTYTSTFPDNTVLSVDTFSNNVWSATPSQGLIAYNGSGIFTYYTSSNSNLGSDNLTFVEGDNDLFIGSYDTGIFRFSSGIFDNFSTSNSPLPVDHVHCIEVIGPDVWVGTNGGGLSHLGGFNSINETIEKHKLSIAYHHQTIHFNEVLSGQLHIYDLNGKKLHSSYLQDTKSLVLPLKAGLYLINIHHKNTVYTGKFVSP